MVDALAAPAAESGPPSANPWASPSLLPADASPPAGAAHAESSKAPADTRPLLSAPVSTAPAAPAPPVDSSILDEFDPLASSSKAAWSSSPGHLPPSIRTSLPSTAILSASPTADVHSEGGQEVTIPPLNSEKSLATASTMSSPRSMQSPITTLSELARRASEHEDDPPADPDGKGRGEGKEEGLGMREPKLPAPFDFQKFLEQMKARSAEPVAKYLKSFLHNFAKRTFTVNEQVKLIHDFLAFIAVRMRECEVWKSLPSDEFDNACEAMEKLVMNRLYHLTFTPAIDRNTYPITTDDLERDHVLRQRIRLFSWVREEHLDIPTGEGSNGFIMFAEQELLKINHYKAPRDKLICILNACKVIFGLIRHLNREEGADAFIPVLIFVVLQANPDHLLSNVEYISRFRSPSKLQSEAGYYLSSLMGAVSFIETMDHTSLSNITQEEFEKNVEEAIQNLSPSPTPATPIKSPTLDRPNPMSPAAGEESARPLLLPATFAEDTRRFFQRTGDLAQQTISKPLSAIGRIFTEALEQPAREQQQQGGSSALPTTPPQTGRQPPAPIQVQAPYKARVRSSPSASGRSTPLSTPSRSITNALAAPFSFSSALSTSPSGTPRQPTPDPDAEAGGETFDFAALSAEIDRAHDAAQAAGRDTLLQIFPGLDGEVADMVLEANNGDLGRSIDKLLEMGLGS